MRGLLTNPNDRLNNFTAINISDDIVTNIQALNSRFAIIRTDEGTSQEADERQHGAAVRIFRNDEVIVRRHRTCERGGPGACTFGDSQDAIAGEMNCTTRSVGQIIDINNSAGTNHSVC